MIEKDFKREIDLMIEKYFKREIDLNIGYDYPINYRVKAYDGEG